MSGLGAAEQLSAALDAEDAEVRRQAIAALSVYGGQDSASAGPSAGAAAFTPVLLRALGDADWRVRKEATLAGRRLLEAAAGERDAAATQALLDGLLGALGPGDNVGLRNAAIEVLGSHGQAAIPALVHAFAGLDADGRKLAIEALGRTRDEAALEVLERALSDADENVRHAAIEAIASMGPIAREDVLELLLRVLRDPDRFGRLTALHGLIALEARVPWALLEPLTEDPMLRPMALSAAALAESPEAPAALVRTLASARGSAFAQILAALSRLADGPLATEVAEALRRGGPAVAARLVQEASEPPALEPASWRGPGSEQLGQRSRALVLAALARADGAVEAAVQALAEPALAEPAQRALLSLGLLAMPAVLSHLTSGAELDPDQASALIDVAVGIVKEGEVSRPTSAPGSQHAELCAVLRAAVESRSTMVATSALYALAKLGGEEELLLAAEQTRVAALPAARAAERALAVLAVRHPDAARALARKMMQREETYLPAVTVIEALGAAGAEEMSFLTQAAAAGHPRARRAAVAALAAAAGPAALDVLGGALADEEREVQLAAARALGRLCAELEPASEGSIVAQRIRELIELLRRSGDVDLITAVTRAREGDANPDSRFQSERAAYADFRPKSGKTSP